MTEPELKAVSPDSKLRLVHTVRPAANLMQVPLISIIIAAYHHESYVEECLASINQAKLAPLDLIIIDDNSPDATLHKCLSFSYRSDISVRIYTKSNLGLIHSLRTGLKLAQGRYVAFIAADDFYSDGAIDSAALVLQSAADLDVLLCQAVMFGLQERLVYRANMEKLFTATPFDRLEALLTEPPKPMLLQATVFKTEFLRRLRPWEDDLELDDWPTFIRVFVAEAHHGAVIRYEPAVHLCHYRVHAAGLHSNLDRQLLITEQVANSFVPRRYRSLCLANARIDNGLIHIYQGRWRKGISICTRGLLTKPSIPVFRRLSIRAWRFFKKIFTHNIPDTTTKP